MLILRGKPGDLLAIHGVVVRVVAARRDRVVLEVDDLPAIDSSPDGSEPPDDSRPPEDRPHA